MRSCACDPADNDRNNKLPMQWSRRGEGGRDIRIQSIGYVFLAKNLKCDGDTEKILQQFNFKFIQIFTKSPNKFLLGERVPLFIFSKMHSNGPAVS